MAILNQKRILNLIPKISAPVTLHVSQGDVGTEIQFTLVKGDELFVNPGNVSASVHGVREDGANFGAFTCTLSGSTVSFPLHSEMTAVKGSALAEIVIVDNLGNKVGSANFAILIEESVFPLGVTYDNDVSVYESILAYVQTIPAQLEADITTAMETINNALATEANARATKDANLQTQIDEIVAPSGEAPNPAEVVDARIDVNGTVHNSLGNSIRSQVNGLLVDVNKLDFDLSEAFVTNKIFNRSISSYNVSVTAYTNFKGFATRFSCSSIGKIVGVRVNRINVSSLVENHDAKVTVVIMDDSKNVIASRIRKIPYKKCNTELSTYDFMIEADLSAYNNVYVGVYTDLNDNNLRVTCPMTTTNDPNCSATSTYTNLYLSSSRTEPNWSGVSPYNSYALSCAFMTEANSEFNGQFNNLKVAYDIAPYFVELKVDKDNKTLGFTGSSLVFFSGYPNYSSVTANTSYDLSNITPNTIHYFGMRSGQIFYIGTDDLNYHWKENEAFLCCLWINGNWTSAYIFSFIPRDFIIDSSTNDKHIIKKKTDIIMPSFLYGLNGDSSYLYIENAIKNIKGLDSFDFYASRSVENNLSLFTNAKETKYPRIVLPYSGGSDVTFTLKDYLNDVEKSKSVTIRSTNKTSGSSCKIIVVGDSFRRYQYGNVGILKAIKDFAIEDGMTINMLGTLSTAYGVASEARGGWTEDDFYTLYVPTAQRDPSAPTEYKKMPSPFVFSDDDTVANSYFSFAKYMSENSMQVPDIVMFALGMNYSSQKGAYINAMISDIHSYNPNIKIIVSTIAACPKNYNGKYYYNKDLRDSQNESYISLFDNRENEGIYICSEHLSLDGNLGIQGVSNNVSPISFEDDDVVTEWCNNGIHPTQIGAWCIAKLNYETIGYVMQQ